MSPDGAAEHYTFAEKGGNYDHVGPDDYIGPYGMGSQER